MTPETRQILFEEIINDISVNGKSLRNAAKGKMSVSTFYIILDSDIEKSKQYARACEERAEYLADEVLDIADSVGQDLIIRPDGSEVVNHKVIDRDKLRVESRKWLIGKLAPKKYGDKIDVTSNGDKLEPPMIIFKRSNE